MTPKELVADAQRAIRFLTVKGLSDRENVPYLHRNGKWSSVTFKGADGLVKMLKDKPYSELYSEMLAEQIFTALMLDGSLIQMSYEVSGSQVNRHRLAYLPNPSMALFDDDPEVYLKDQLFADIVSRKVIVTPIRFDYDSRTNVHIPVIHPVSHLTLGQVASCRIPVSAPIAPSQFLDFILRSFYSEFRSKHGNDFPPIGRFGIESLHPLESQLIHLRIP